MSKKVVQKRFSVGPRVDRVSGKENPVPDPYKAPSSLLENCRFEFQTADESCGGFIAGLVRSTALVVARAGRFGACRRVQEGARGTN